MKKNKCAAALLLALPLAAAAEQPFSFDATPGQLPKTVVPERYAIEITPDLEHATFSGTVAIDLKVRQPTDRIVLNALALQVQSASLHPAKGPAQELKPELDAEQQTLAFAIGRKLAPGKYRLDVAYTGLINPQPQGLDYVEYPTPSGRKRMLATQMEPADARRMLPCWDEPVFRAVFQLGVTLPKDLAAYSNTPIEKEDALDGGRKHVRFAPTPKMASYLLVLVAGELERKSADGAVQTGLVTTAGKLATADYALKSGVDLLGFYDDYFGVRFPLPKLDHYAVPGGFPGAMENWGGITYNESILLFDPAKSSDATKRDVFHVMAHEMAHQWFGDLVTTAWWDNLWLNEGFASWMGTKATDHFNPGWKAWLAANSEKQRAMSLDARKTTHPIQQRVRNVSEANDAFDDITYRKGQSFLRMLETWLGEDVFRKGIRSYMKQHAYSSTTTADLWRSLGDASGKPVARMARAWTERPGFPVVKVSDRCENGQRRVKLSQERFSFDAEPPAPLTWPVPVTLGDGLGGHTRTLLLEGPSMTVTMPDCTHPLVVDPDDTGYFRVQYAPQGLEALAAEFAQLGAPARIKLLADGWAMVAANRQPLERYFELVDHLGEEPERAAWTEVIARLNLLDLLARGQPLQAALRTHAIRVVQPKLQQLGWEERPGDDDQIRQLRADLINALGDYGEPGVIAEARRRFDQFLRESASLPRALREPVMHVVGKHADARQYAALRKLAKDALTTEDRRLYYEAMAAALDEKLSAQTLELTLTDEMPPDLAAQAVQLVAGDGAHDQQAWDFAQKHVDALLGKLASFEHNVYLGRVLSGESDARYADELIAFTSQHLPKDAMTEAERAADRIRFQARLKEKVLPQAQALLAK